MNLDPITPAMYEMLSTSRAQTTGLLNYDMECNKIINNLRNCYNKKWPTKEYFNNFCDTKPFINKKYYNKPFGEEVEQLAELNSKSTLGLDEYSEMVLIWEALLEYEACKDVHFNKFSNLREICYNLKFFFSNLNFSYTRKLEWTFRGSTGVGFCGLISTIFTINRYDAMATLEYLLGMKFSNILHFSNDRHNCEFSSINCQYDIPEALHLRNTIPNCKIVEFDKLIRIYGSSHQIIGGFVRYSWENRKFYLPASVGNGVLSIGKYKPTAHLLNQDLLDRYPYAKILYFQDFSTAVEIMERLEEISGYEPAEFIITGSLCNQLNILPLLYFIGHDIFFIPAPSKAGIASFAEYFKFISGTGAKSCKIIPQFFLAVSPSMADSRETKGAREEETSLLREAVVVPECENIIVVLRNAIKNALDLNEYQRWSEILGIGKISKNIPEKIAGAADSSLSIPNAALLPPKSQGLSGVSIFHTFRPGNYIYIVGKKGGGKTHLCFSLCAQLLHGSSIWPFFHGGNKFEENICFVDGETPQDEFDQNLNQYGLNGVLNKRLFCLTIFGNNQPDFFRDFSLGDEDCRKGLKGYLLQNKCRILILDSLLLLTNHAPDACVRSVLDFIKELQLSGICVVLTNHKSQEKNDKARSNENYLNEARVVISIVDKDEILASDTDLAIAKKYADKDGLTLGLKYTHHKTVPSLQNKTIYLHLPLYSDKWSFLEATGLESIPSSWYETDQDSEKSHTIEEENSASAVSDIQYDGLEKPTDVSKLLQNISPDARKVYGIIKDKGGTATREDLQESYEKSKDTILKIIEELMERNLVKRSGSGRSTYYALAN